MSAKHGDSYIGLANKRERKKHTQQVELEEEEEEEFVSERGLGVRGRSENFFF